MNRAARRLFESQNRPAGRFYGELQRRATDRAYREQLRRQMTEESNGAPIPPDILAGMTKPRETEDLYQVGVTMKETGGGQIPRSDDGRRCHRDDRGADQPRPTHRPPQ